MTVSLGKIATCNNDVIVTNYFGYLKQISASYEHKKLK